MLVCAHICKKKKEKAGNNFGLDFEVKDVQTSWANVSTLTYLVLE